MISATPQTEELAASLKKAPWFSQSEYPFKANYFSTPEGKMHYVDEGEGEPIVFIHGTPAWSFVYRRLLKAFSATHRCIAPDHLGFGLSEKPPGADYSPQAHALRLEALLNSLNLKKVNLVVHDIGGPIGLAYALKYPDKINRVVVANSWLWSLEREASAQQANKILNSWLGRFLYLRLNISPTLLFKEGVAQKKQFSKAIHKHYTDVFPTPASRQALYQIGLGLLGASDWYTQLERQLPLLHNKPVLLLWGLKDKYFREPFLEKWQQALPQAETTTFKDGGHFIQEDVPEEVEKAISGFLKTETPA
jgi:pimeloyl-ACP methyl ester carboxylesterase